MSVTLGKTAPNFELKDTDGRTHRLRDYRDTWVLVYFYPKDDTPGCTTEACGIRDRFPDFKKLDITVFGISVDSAASHKKFVEKYHLPFTLLTDEEKRVVKAWGVWAKKKFMGREYMGTARTSFLIDPHGTVAKIYRNVKPDAHADEVLRDVALSRR